MGPRLSKNILEIQQIESGTLAKCWSDGRNVAKVIANLVQPFCQKQALVGQRPIIREEMARLSAWTTQSGRQLPCHWSPEVWRSISGSWFCQMPCTPFAPCCARKPTPHHTNACFGTPAVPLVATRCHHGSSHQGLYTSKGMSELRSMTLLSRKSN